MGFRVLKGGMLTTVQDLGRTGYQSQGFSVSGVMDVRSFKIANLLLDNPENEAVLEFTLMGPSLEFTSETIIAITGGDFQPRVNKKPVKMYTALYMHKGDVLDFAGCRTGSRGYIAFAAPEAEDTLHFPVIWTSRSSWEAVRRISNAASEASRDAGLKTETISVSGSREDICRISSQEALTWMSLTMRT